MNELIANLVSLTGVLLHWHYPNGKVALNDISLALPYHGSKPFVGRRSVSQHLGRLLKPALLV